MPTPTWTPMANITLGSAASSVTFSNIPNTYRDLILIVEGTATGNANINLQFNGDTNANYSWIAMSGDGSAGSSFGQSGITNAPATRFGYFVTGNRSNSIIQIMDYSATDKHKVFLSRSNNVTSGTDAQAARWANTAAIYSIRLIFQSGSLSIASGSTFSLYGVL